MKTTFVTVSEDREILEVFGPTVYFLTPVWDNSVEYCQMRGMIPTGISVPLHSHPDAESFYILSGEVQVLINEDENANWVDMKAGDFIHLPPGVKHAWRNISDKPVEGLITTTPRLGSFSGKLDGIPTQANNWQRPRPNSFSILCRLPANIITGWAAWKKMKRWGSLYWGV